MHSLPKFLPISQPPSREAKEQETDNSAYCLESIQAAAHSSKARRDRIFAAGYAKGFEEGKESGFTLGLAERIDMGKDSAARANATEIASLQATNKAVHKQHFHILEQSNGVATGQLIATQTASNRNRSPRGHRRGSDGRVVDLEAAERRAKSTLRRAGKRVDCTADNNFQLLRNYFNCKSFNFCRYRAPTLQFI
jgi:hypothetical protein